MSIRVAVVGGGAAGMLAAGIAAMQGASVTLYEKNERLGRKLRITGKGRCNVTNDCDRQTLLQNVLRNPRFLYSALSQFDCQDTMRFFEGLGVPLKTERGNRVFPISDRAEDVVDALRRFLDSAGVAVVHRTVTGIATKDGAVCGVKLGTHTEPYDRVLVATGGRSYPQTGSTGDGYRFARECGHTVVAQRPSLVPVEAEERDCGAMMGLSLKNVTLSLWDTETNSELFCELGEMLFTHFGLSGPLVLSASTHMTKAPLSRYQLRLDLKPALDEKTLDARLQRELSENANRNFSNMLEALLPKKMIDPFVARVGIAPDRKCHSITRAERGSILRLLKQMTFTVRALRPISEAIVTAGGVSVSEVDPKSMQSKCVKGLYFAGEVLDIDAYTGGFNLQLAFSTAYAAGMAAGSEDYT